MKEKELEGRTSCEVVYWKWIYNKMDNFLLVVSDINHKFIVVERKMKIEETIIRTGVLYAFMYRLTPPAG